eukprot:CAMPEP_0170501992 /NCGR_PEP_ID=MMETSP0208-20121228/40170_1 /TAXON_ID=197538 /ORGANISM="Strombidium inclinatum, Strain S3" /LENGTH=54 /DNA_ID=CAMNT_0010780845 /DNA_START=1778 /DNA_END=1942 /DNA_ORIENTATION=-
MNKTFFRTSNLNLLRLKVVSGRKRTYERKVVDLVNDTYLKKMIKQFRKEPEVVK